MKPLDRNQLIATIVVIVCLSVVVLTAIWAVTSLLIALLQSLG